MTTRLHTGTGAAPRDEPSGNIRN